MLSPKWTSTPQRQAAWAVRLGEVVAAPLYEHGREAEEAVKKEDSFLNADASSSAAVEEAEAERDDRARLRTRTSERRHRSSRSLDWQAASSARESAELQREAAAATAAAWASRREGLDTGGDGRVEWWTHQQHLQTHPHPHPLHSHPQNPTPNISPSLNVSPSPTSPAPSLPSPSIYSRASVITTYTRRPSDMDPYHFRRRPSAPDSVPLSHLRRRPSAADAYATIVEDDDDDNDADAEWHPSALREDDGDGDEDEGNGVVEVDQEKWWMALRKASDATTATMSNGTVRGDVGEAGAEGDVFDRRGSAVSELRRRPMSWTADLGA
ncbi:hypothetical protein IWZ03DRAFT_86880 [Phyllosticta citriasiana]|uniref:Uncharacterized protein n=1 Tax=Phyllosticta citriasiana TaxID=595635 RepID=A0ABR1KBV3_9PEZI